MSIEYIASLHCDICYETIEMESDYPIETQNRLIQKARNDGWKLEDEDLCPQCAKANKEQQK